MSKKGPQTEHETSRKVAHPFETAGPMKGTPPMPAGLDADALREWNRLVAERQAQPDGIFLHDGPLIELAAQAFSYRVKIEQLARRWGVPGSELASRDWKESYLVSCHALGCTPTIPNMREES